MFKFFIKKRIKKIDEMIDTFEKWQELETSPYHGYYYKAAIRNKERIEKTLINLKNKKEELSKELI